VNVVAEEITERKRADAVLAASEKALRESETRFRELADNISQLAWTADQSGWIYWYNKRWYDYTGTTLE
jgi:PAS domain-containing protein